MRNPPDFVMYVLMYKPDDEFIPYWQGKAIGAYAMGYKHKVDANKRLKVLRQIWGEKNAYVQQYGPYS